jgi:integrase
MRLLLTDRFCERAKVTKQTDYFDEKVSGLALRVSAGAKSWSLMYKVGGRKVRITLGRYPTMSLGAARTRALEAKVDIAEGRSPVPAAAGTLRSVVDEHVRREAGLRTIELRRRIFERLVLPVLGDHPITDIRRTDIVRLLDRIEDDNGPSAAHVTLAHLSALFNWYASRNDDFHSPIVRGMGRVKPKERARNRTLSDDEIRLVWTAASGAGTFGRLVQFLLLVGVRRNEAAHMSRAELKGDVWTIPAERMKAKAEHVVPLSPMALALLPAKGEWMFGDPGPLTNFSRRKAKLDRAVPMAQGWVLHDLRRTARSLLSRAGVNADIAERCLAHTIGGVRGVYDRHAYLEEKRAAFERLASLVQSIVDPPAGMSLRADK